MQHIALIIIFCGGVILTAGDIILKKWIETNKSLFYVIGILIYIVGLNFLAQSFKFKNIAVASVMMVIINVIILSIFSWLYFKETLSIYQIIGIILGLAAITILEFAPVK